MDMKLQEKILRDRWHELTARLRKIDTDLGRTKETDDDDRAIENENDEVLEGLGQAGEDELRAIDAALERIAKGHLWHLRPLWCRDIGSSPRGAAADAALRGLRGRQVSASSKTSMARHKDLT